MNLLQLTTIYANNITENVFFYLFIILSILSIIAFRYGWVKLKRKASEIKNSENQHIIEITSIKNEHSTNQEKLRVEMLKREDDRVRQWVESEKETLHVLNGVSTLMELSDKVDKVEFSKLNNILLAIESKIAIEKELTNKLQENEIRYRQLFDNVFVGIALHEMIFDENGHPFDYKFIEVNTMFESITNLNATDVVGSTCRQLLPDAEKYWIDTFGKVVLTQKPIIFESFNTSTNLTYKVAAYPQDQNKFIAIFMAIK